MPTNTPPAKKLAQSETSRLSTVKDAPPSTFTPPPLPFSSGSEHPTAEKLRSDATVPAPATYTPPPRTSFPVPSAPPEQSIAAESASATVAPSRAATPPPAPPEAHARNTVSVTSTFAPAPEAKSPPPVARVAFLISSARIRTACGGFATSPPAPGAEPHSIEANGAGTTGSESTPDVTFASNRREPTSPETRTGMAAPSSAPQFPARACSPGRNTSSAGAASVNVAPEAAAAASATARSAQGAQYAPHALESALKGVPEASGAMNTRAALSRAGSSAEGP